jgi:hypothetical protein
VQRLSGLAAELLSEPLRDDYVSLERDAHGDLNSRSASRESKPHSLVYGHEAALVQFSQDVLLGVEVDLRDAQPSGRSGAPSWARS